LLHRLHTSSAQFAEPPAAAAAIYEVINEDHLPFWMPQNTLDFGVVELA
jgi:hypothetical protein